MYLLLVVCCLLLAVWINFQVAVDAQKNGNPKWTYFYLPSEYAVINSELQLVLADATYKDNTACVEIQEAFALLFWYVDCNNNNHAVFVTQCGATIEYIEVDRNDKNELEVRQVVTDPNVVGITGAGYEQDWSDDIWKAPGEAGDGPSFQEQLMTKIKDQLKYQKLTYSDGGEIPLPWSSAWNGVKDSFSEFCPCPKSLPNADILKTKEENGVHYVKMLIACHLDEGAPSKASRAVKIDIAMDVDLENLGDGAATLVAIGKILDTLEESEQPKCKNEEGVESACPDCKFNDNTEEATGPTCKYVKADTDNNGSMKIGPDFTLLIASLLCILAAFRSH